MNKLKILVSKKLFNSHAFWFLTVCFCCSSQLFSQQQNLPLNSYFSTPEEIIIHQSDEIIHSGFKPIVQSELKVVDLTNNYSADTSFFLAGLKKYRAEGSLLKRKLFYEHLFVVNKNDFYLTLDPLFDFSFGKELDIEDNEMLYKNMRGFLLRANIGKKVSIQSSFRENQARFAGYINEHLYHEGDILGQGKSRKLDNGGYDFSMASAYVSYSPSDKVNLQIGHGKHFVGNGAQSHFLSDRPYNYPFLRVNTEWLEGGLKYTNLFASLQELKRMPYVEHEGLHYRKMGNFIFMDFALSSSLYIGLFEGRVWEIVDTATGKNVLPATAYLPVFGVNTILENMDNKKSNGTIGVNFRWDLSKLVQVYSQAAMHSKNDFSAQLGIKYYPVKNLFLQLEYNHRDLDSMSPASSEIAYSHYSRPLGFDKEKQFSFRAAYRYKRFLIDTELSYFSVQNENISYAGHNIGYLINPAINFSFNFGLIQRHVIDGDKESKIFYVSLRTNMQNIFYDI